MRAWPRMWASQPRALEGLHSLPAARPHSSRSRTRVTAATSSQMQPASPPDAAAKTQHWCRPLTSHAPASHADQQQGQQGGPQQQHPPPIVALGKFDALHRGHRALADAAAALGGTPWMISFSGMAEVLGWPARLPLVAPCDRQRVLDAWAPHCQGRQPRECAIPFAEVRSMSPEAFVELLAAELQAAGVVVGSNYRFGYRAAGTAQLLQELGPQHGLKVRVLTLVGSEGKQQRTERQQAAAAAAAAADEAAEAAHQQQGAAQGQAQQQQQQQQQQQHDPLAAISQGEQGQEQPSQQPTASQASRQQQQPSPQQRAADRQEAHSAVSSSRVRHALAAGDVHDAAECLGRPYRLVASLADAATSELPDGRALRLPAAALLNQPPGAGRYAVRAVLTGADTRQELAAALQGAALAVDEAGLTLHGAGGWLAALPAGARHLALDFL